MMVIFVAVTALSVAYGRARAANDAEASATRDAIFGADLAARHVDLDLENVHRAIADGPLGTVGREAAVTR